MEGQELLTSPLLTSGPVPQAASQLSAPTNQAITQANSFSDCIRAASAQVNGLEWFVIIRRCMDTERHHKQFPTNVCGYSLKKGTKTEWSRIMFPPKH